MAWIKTIPPEQAEGRLALAYRRLGAPGQTLDQIVLVHALRPHTLDAHMALYRSVLHHPENNLPTAFAELIGVLVSRINGCGYCVAHHRRGVFRTVDADTARGWLDALDSGDRAVTFDARQQAALAYVEKLTRQPAGIERADVQTMIECGWSEAEVLEINQVAAYFAYANRTVLGLGVALETAPHPRS